MPPGNGFNPLCPNYNPPAGRRKRKSGGGGGRNQVTHLSRKEQMDRIGVGVALDGRELLTDRWLAMESVIHTNIWKRTLAEQHQGQGNPIHTPRFVPGCGKHSSVFGRGPACWPGDSPGFEATDGSRSHAHRCPLANRGHDRGRGLPLYAN